MKYKFQGETLNFKVTTTWKEITNTNIGHVAIDKLKKRVWMNPTTENARNFRSSGLAKATSFPPTLIAPELVMAYREAYQEETRTIVDRDGNVLANMSPKSITRNFHIPTFREMEVLTKDDGMVMWDQDPLKCKRLINQYWLKQKRGSVAKVP